MKGESEQVEEVSGDEVSRPEEAGRQRHKRDERRHDLIVAAYQIIAERGFEGLRVREVAERVKVNIATLHYYFHTKADLVRGVVDYLLHQFLTVTAPVPEEDVATADQQLRQAFMDLAYQLEQMPAMFIVLNELHLHSQRDEAVRAMLHGLNDGWHAHIEGLCREGIEQQLFRSDLDPARAASEVIALIMGMSVQAIANLDRFDFERIGTDVVEWFTRG